MIPWKHGIFLLSGDEVKTAFEKVFSDVSKKYWKIFGRLL